MISKLDKYGDLIMLVIYTAVLIICGMAITGCQDFGHKVLGIEEERETQYVDNNPMEVVEVPGQDVTEPTRRIILDSRFKMAQYVGVRVYVDKDTSFPLPYGSASFYVDKTMIVVTGVQEQFGEVEKVRMEFLY